MQDSKLRLGCLCLGLALGGCRVPAQIPYDLTSVRASAAPAHNLIVAILPLEDARDPAEAPDADGRYVYNGLTYRGTRLEDLGPQATAKVTEVLAQHLAKSRVFAQVILVLSPDQAPEADLVLSGKIRRARGYVEAKTPPKASGRNPDSRKVIAEVVLQDLELRPVGGGPPRIALDVGWSILEERPVQPETGAPHPWHLLSEAMAVSLRDLTAILRTADLSGAFVAAKTVSLDATATSTQAVFHGLSAPSGWAVVKTSSATHPIGWNGAPRCHALRLEARQSRRFSRVLGPYVPAVEVWACPESVQLKLAASSEYPARLVGQQGGNWYFTRQLGRSNWRDAEAQIANYLHLRPPPSPYVFEVGPGVKAPPKAMPIQRSLRRRIRRPKARLQSTPGN